MSFEVASIRQSNPESPSDSNIDLDYSDYSRYTGGLVKTNLSLIDYLFFAYKITDTSQLVSLNAQLPKWAQSERFHIEARAEGNPTKDQMRLMMQSLLADRFKLAIHIESQQLPVYALLLDKSGKTGTQLRPHSGEALCKTVPGDPTPTARPLIPPPSCGESIWQVNGLTHMRVMDFTMQQISGSLATPGENLGGLDQRPIVDRTLLHGRFDIDLEFLRESRGPRSSDTDPQYEISGPTFIEALQKQAGLRLVKQIAPVDVYVIDHIEMPSEN